MQLLNMSDKCRQCGQLVSEQDEYEDEDGLCDECHYRNEAANQRDEELEERRLEL